MSEVAETFKNQLARSEWMDEETRNKAIEKLSAIRYDIAFPHWLLNQTYVDNYYAELRVTDDYALNQFLSVHQQLRRNLALLRKDPKEMWSMTPNTVNAYYDNNHNKFVLPAGILNRPFYYPERGLPLALTYGGLGSVIVHEVSLFFVLYEGGA